MNMTTMINLMNLTLLFLSSYVYLKFIQNNIYKYILLLYVITTCEDPVLLVFVFTLIVLYAYIEDKIINSYTYKYILSNKFWIKVVLVYMVIYLLIQILGIDLVTFSAQTVAACLSVVSTIYIYFNVVIPYQNKIKEAIQVDYLTKLLSSKICLSLINVISFILALLLILLGSLSFLILTIIYKGEIPDYMESSYINNFNAFDVYNLNEYDQDDDYISKMGNSPSRSPSPIKDTLDRLKNFYDIDLGEGSKGPKTPKEGSESGASSLQEESNSKKRKADDSFEDSPSKKLKNLGSYYEDRLKMFNRDSPVSETAFSNRSSPFPDKVPLHKNSPVFKENVLDEDSDSSSLSEAWTRDYQNPFENKDFMWNKELKIKCYEPYKHYFEIKGHKYYAKEGTNNQSYIQRVNGIQFIKGLKTIYPNIDEKILIKHFINPHYTDTDMEVKDSLWKPVLSNDDTYNQHEFLRTGDIVRADWILKLFDEVKSQDPNVDLKTVLDLTSRIKPPINIEVLQWKHRLISKMWYQAQEYHDRGLLDRLFASQTHFKNKADFCSYVKETAICDIEDFDDVGDLEFHRSVSYSYSPLNISESRLNELFNRYRGSFYRVNSEKYEDSRNDFNKYKLNYESMEVENSNPEMNKIDVESKYINIFRHDKNTSLFTKELSTLFESKDLDFSSEEARNKIENLISKAIELKKGYNYPRDRGMIANDLGAKFIVKLTDELGKCTNEELKNWFGSTLVRVIDELNEEYVP